MISLFNLLAFDSTNTGAWVIGCVGAVVLISIIVFCSFYIRSKRALLYEENGYVKETRAERKEREKREKLEQELNDKEKKEAESELIRKILAGEIENPDGFIENFFRKLYNLSTDENDGAKATTDTAIDDEDSETMVKGFDENKNVVIAKYVKSFMARYIMSSDSVKKCFGIVKNALLSFDNVENETTWDMDVFKYNGKPLVAMNVNEKSLYVYYSLFDTDIGEVQYNVEFSIADKYYDYPCIYTVDSEQKVENALDLIDILKTKYNLVKIERKPVNYYIPYKTREVLVKKGLITETIIEKI